MSHDTAPDMRAFPSAGHDHAACRAALLEAAQDKLAAEGARLTAQRRAVLEAMLEDHRPQGAYELMERIDWRGRRPAPAAIYRALDFLVAHGLAHRIESRNAYLACTRVPAPHRPVILLCTGCGRAGELDDRGPSRTAARAAARAGFTAHRVTIEIEGLCADCAAPARGAAGMAPARREPAR